MSEKAPAYETDDEKEPTDLFALAEKRTRAVMQTIRRWGSLRKDGDHPYTQEQIAAMVVSIDQAWERAKKDFEAGSFSLPKTS